MPARNGRNGFVDPVVLLKTDHREAKEMLRALEHSAPGARRRRTVEKLVGALRLHMELEERLLYPVVEREQGAEAAEEATIEHRLAQEEMVHLAEMVDAPGFGAVVSMLTAGIRHHVREEESEVFPRLKRELDRAQLGELGAELAAGKRAASRR
jgi:iron-sulfur cluster repair protein YtfE (RIC family)